MDKLSIMKNLYFNQSIGPPEDHQGVFLNLIE